MTSTVEPRRAPPKVVRVAIYCRKSVEKGAPEALTSIDAQRTMVEGYVASHSEEGWRALPDRFDDAGVSGATLARPSFQRLMNLVRSGGVEVIAVYRLDRVSRSMLDFLQLQAACEKIGVQFVSISERLDTTTAMGRFGIQLIMAVAQLERGTTAERVRDKFKTSRARGLWTGGTPPLGLDSVKGELRVNEPEAEVARAIFRLYLDLRSLSALVSETAARGWRQKQWTSKHGKRVGGAAFDKNRLRKLLTNVLYIGRTRWGDADFPGQHKAIIDRPLWDAVQAALAEARPEKPQRRKQAWSSLLGGMLRCGCGATMGHHYTSRHGRKYEFYVCAKLTRLNAAACPGSRVRCSDLDEYAVERLRAIGRDRALVAATVEAAGAADEGELRRVLAELTQLWDVMHLPERQRVLRLLIEQITYTAATRTISFELRDSGVRALAAELGGTP